MTMAYACVAPAPALALSMRLATGCGCWLHWLSATQRDTARPASKVLGPGRTEDLDIRFMVPRTTDQSLGMQTLIRSVVIGSSRKDPS